jgi:limonene-1,2-epoxide hydrolase
MGAEDIVRAEMAAWARNDIDEVISHFADDLTLYVGPYPPVSGRDAIRTTMAAYFSRGTCVDLKILHVAVDGAVVLMERDDHWIVNGQEMHWPVMGAYEVTDGKITAWREYFTPVKVS